MQGAFISASPRLCGKIVSQIFAHIFPAIHPASIQSIPGQAAGETASVAAWQSSELSRDSKNLVR